MPESNDNPHARCYRPGVHENNCTCKFRLEAERARKAALHREQTPPVPPVVTGACSDTAATPAPANASIPVDAIQALGDKLAVLFGFDAMPNIGDAHLTVANIRGLKLSEEIILGAARFGLADDFWADYVVSVEKLYEYLKKGTLLSAYMAVRRKTASASCPHGCCTEVCGEKCWHCHAKKGCNECGGSGMKTVRVPSTTRDVGTACDCTGIAESMEEIVKKFPKRPKVPDDSAEG